MQAESTPENLPSYTAENPFTNVVAPLTKGLLKTYEPSLKQIETALNELTKKELSLLAEVHSENLNLSATQHSDELNDVFKKIELYQAKLVNIKREMKSLHDKSTKLKKRALKLQQLKEKQEYVKQQKEAEIKQEQSLIAKSGTNL